MPTLDTLTIEILEDGTIRTSSDKISAANHTTADNLLSVIAKLAGGDVKITRRGSGHAHAHGHDHSHSHDHDHERSSR